MTNLEILVLLGDIKKSNFLDSFILIKQNQKQYKKSQFYKETKISLAELYKLYYQYTENQYGLIDKITEILDNLNIDFVADKMKEILKSFINSEELKDILDSVMEKFDLKNLAKENKQLGELLEKFQNLK